MIKIIIKEYDFEQKFIFKERDFDWKNFCKKHDFQLNFFRLVRFWINFFYNASIF